MQVKNQRLYTLIIMELPHLYFTFSISVLAVLLRTAGLPVFGLSSNLHDLTIFFIQCSLPCNIFDVSHINIPEQLKIEALMIVYKLFQEFSSLKMETIY